MSEALTRLVAELPRESITRLNTETLNRRMFAARIEVVCTDDGSKPPNQTQLKYAAEAIAARGIAEQLAWPVSPDALVAQLVKLGTPRPTAEEAASRLEAEGIIRVEREQIADAQAADFLTAQLSAAAFRVNAIRPAGDPAPAPDPVAPTGLKPHTNPTVTEAELIAPHVPTPQPPEFPEVSR